MIACLRGCTRRARRRSTVMRVVVVGVLLCVLGVTLGWPSFFTIFNTFTSGSSDLHTVVAWEGSHTWAAATVRDMQILPLTQRAEARPTSQEQAAGPTDPRLEQRDVFLSGEAWPQVGKPGEVPSTVHYLWCDSKVFRFEHYLGVLSGLRVLRPMKLVFHYTHLPLNDSYHDWFQEMLNFIPNMELQPLKRQTSEVPACGSQNLLYTALGFLASTGGVYMGENVLLTHMPSQVLNHDPFWHSFRSPVEDSTHGIVYIRHGFNDSSSARRQYMEDILSRPGPSSCVSVEQFNQEGAVEGNECVTLDSKVYPVDIWDARSKFAELARWLYYGKCQPLVVKRSAASAESIPRIMHSTWFRSKKNLYKGKFAFHFFLSVLSALHVGGFEHVYVHGDEEPTGAWWKKLETENVTFVRLDRPEKVYQQVVGETRASHLSNVLRLIILHKYGGGYQDLDVLWTSRVPDWLLTYPAVMSSDWPTYREWPSSFNNGVMLGRRGAPFLYHWLKTFRSYYDNVLFYNSIMMPYKVYERHPDSMYVDPYLQVICYKSLCHPTWQPDFRRQLTDSRPPSQPWHWSEARAVHVTYPKPERSLANVWALKNGTDMFAEVGRFVLEKSGRLSLLPPDKTPKT